MINNIIDGICIALNKEFGDGYAIYTENVKQGLNNPCFLIQLVTTVNTALQGTKNRQNNHFVITYFPADDEKNEDLIAAAERMDFALDIISLVDESKERCINKTYRLDYDMEVAQFEFDINISVGRAVNKDEMRDLKCVVR